MITNIDDRKFMRDMNNIIAYANGFIEGTKIGKPMLMKNLGERLKVIVGEFIDSNARVDPNSLHHVYEWYMVGSPEARLFDLDYNVTGTGLTMSATLTQSSSVANGSSEPFYNKARIMESGAPVRISPKKAQALAFEGDSGMVFTKGTVTVSNPGGDSVQGSFHEVFRSFFISYASQSILDLSGLGYKLKTPIEFKNNFAAGKNGGKSVGIRAGIKYISGGTI